MFKKLNNFISNLKTMYKRQSFENKPIRTFFYILVMFIYLIFKIKKKYKIKIKGKNYIYTYKPYKSMGMGGRSQFVLREHYDPFLIHGIDYLPKDFNFIDVGCSRGFFSLFLLANNTPHGKGVCIDPFDYALNDLSEVLSLNNFKNVKILKGVVSNKTNEKTFVRNIDIPSEASIIKKDYFKNENGFYCQAYTIDQLIYSKNLLKSVEFIKIDAEGAELEILQGSLQTLQKLKPIIYLEITRKEDEIKKILSDNGYNFYHFLKNKFVLANDQKLYSSILAKPKDNN